MDYRPYSDDAANQLYALLFCDQPEFSVNLGKVWPALFAPAPDEAALRAIAQDSAIEARVRALAYGRLRQLGKSVPSKLLLGAVIEVPLDAGLDVLAVYAEGGVRYINASGRSRSSKATHILSLTKAARYSRQVNMSSIRSDLGTSRAWRRRRQAMCA